MSEYVIPCEVFARLSNLLAISYDETDEWCNSVRIDRGCAMVTNRHFMVVERIDCDLPDPVHIVADPVLIEQCRKEAQYHSKLHIAVVPAIKYASAKTTFGYQYPGNAALWLAAPNELDKWRSIIPDNVSATSHGGMLLDLEGLKCMIATSPSGRIVVEQNVDFTKPVIVNDAVDPNWFGVFSAREDKLHNPAIIPKWVK